MLASDSYCISVEVHVCCLVCIVACFVSSHIGCCSVWFNFLGRDFFNALSEKDTERFTQMLIKWLCSLFVGIPVSQAQPGGSSFGLTVPDQCDAASAGHLSAQSVHLALACYASARTHTMHVLTVV